MNIIPGTIERIQVDGTLSLVTIKSELEHLKAIIIDTPETCSYLQVGHPINAIFKETEVIVGQGHRHSLSLQNQLKGQVVSIERSQLLSKILIQTSVGLIRSIITTGAVDQLQLVQNSAVTAMIKTNEVMLSE